jgi:hypothetical protein
LACHTLLCVYLFWKFNGVIKSLTKRSDNFKASSPKRCCMEQKHWGGREEWTPEQNDLPVTCPFLANDFLVEMPDCTYGWQADHSDLWFSSAPPENWRSITSEQATAVSCYIPSNYSLSS